MADKHYPSRMSDAQLIRLFRLGIFSVVIETGTVINYKTDKVMTPYVGNKEGHLFVRLYHKRMRRTSAVHRLVWMFATMTPIPDKWEIHHIDGDTAHNAFSNLMCVHPMDHRKLHSLDEVPF